MKSNNSHNAFTIIELIVVIGIIGILMGVIISVFSGSTESARAAKCQSHMRNLAMAVQSYCMESTKNNGIGYFPRASTLTYEDSEGNKQTVHGWLGDESNPYEKSADVRRKCFDNGVIWSSMKGERDSYVCPSHQRYAKERGLGDPLWSYAMSSYFNAGAGQTKQRRYDTFRRSDRYLLFAEVPYATVKVGATEIQTAATSGSALDPVLDSGSESIGFNHKDGRIVSGHVCFADGHVERLRAPNNKGNIQQLTQWLCRPTDKDTGDFDVRFTGTVYEKDTTVGQSQKE